MKTKKWRRIYEYPCGKCGKHRKTFKFGRSKEKICTICFKKKVPENQLSLFESQKAIELNENTVGIILKTTSETLERLNKINNNDYV